MSNEPPLALMARRLHALSPLSEADQTEILALPHVLRDIKANNYIVREGKRAENSCLLRSGFVIRHKIVANGGRQIVSVHMAGDMVNLQNSLLKTADHSVQALTDASVAYIPGKAIIALAAARPPIAIAMWLDTLVDGAIFREWIANVGRRDAKTRTAHVLCEFALRQERAGLATRGKYDLPLTQEQLGDALGLTAVHVNRTLKALEQARLIERDRRTVTISDWDALRKAGDFDPSYLFLELADEVSSALAPDGVGRPGPRA